MKEYELVVVDYKGLDSLDVMTELPTGGVVMLDDERFIMLAELVDVILADFPDVGIMPIKSLSIETEDSL